MLDENRPIIALTLPAAGANASLPRFLVGLHDYDTGLDMESFKVVADFAVDGVPAGQDLAKRFRPVAQGVWEYPLTQPLNDLRSGTLTVSVRDRQGNVARIERRFSIGQAK
jgi:hypothetical protein